MLRAWYHYGTERPRILRTIEYMLWRQLFNVARGALSAIDALKCFVRDAVPLLPLAVNEQDFFCPARGVKADMPVALDYVSSRISRQFITLTVENTAKLPSTNSKERIIKAGVTAAKTKAPRRGDGAALDLSAILTPELWDPSPVSGTVHAVDTAKDTHTRSFEDVESGSDFELGRWTPTRNGPVVEQFNMHSLRSLSTDSGSTSSAEIGDYRSTEMVSLRPRDRPGQALYPVRYNGWESHRGDESCSLIPSSRSESHDSFPSQYGVGPTLRPRTWKRRFNGDPCFLVSPDGRPYAYWPSFYEPSEVQKFHFSLSRANNFQLDNGNEELFTIFRPLEEDVTELTHKLLVALTGTAVFQVCCCSLEKYFELLHTGKLASVLQEDLIFVSGRRLSPSTDLDCEVNIAKIGPFWAKHLAIDGSLQDSGLKLEDAFVQASLTDFVFQIHERERGKIICFPYLPGDTVERSMLTLSTSLYAWRSLRTRLPGRLLPEMNTTCSKWYFVASGNVSLFCDAVPDGLNMDFEISSGAVLVFAGVDSEDLHAAARSATFQVENRMTLDNQPDVLGLLVQSGDPSLEAIFLITFSYLNRPSAVGPTSILYKPWNIRFGRSSDKDLGLEATMSLVRVVGKHFS
ncbi:hypothetical protein VNI00_005328 [Paramarasmius palmivorus]|uniref:Cyclic nucleotide-binding domain-containing protein n=1 Tax=Paramarasmius palmivorus TaxID=297713 RepID=A0AAW0DGI6_9AGAR